MFNVSQYSENSLILISYQKYDPSRLNIWTGYFLVFVRSIIYMYLFLMQIMFLKQKNCVTTINQKAKDQNIPK